MVRIEDLETLADLSTSAKDELIIALLVRLINASGSGGTTEAILTQILNKPIQLDATGLVLNANLDEVETLLRALGGVNLDSSNPNILPTNWSIVDASTTYGPSIGVITTTGVSLATLNVGQKLGIANTASNDGTWGVLDVVDANNIVVRSEAGTAVVAESNVLNVTMTPLGSRAELMTLFDDLITELQLKADLTETQPVSAATLPLPTGASTEATLAGIKTQTDQINFDGTTLGQNAHIVSPPTWTDAVAQAYPTKPVDAAGTPLGTTSNPVIIDEPAPTGLASDQGTATTTAAAIGGGVVKSVLVKNTSLLNDIFIGGSLVTTATGYPLGPGNSLTLEVSDLAQVYVIVAAATEPFAYIGS